MDILVVCTVCLRGINRTAVRKPPVILLMPTQYPTHMLLTISCVFLSLKSFRHQNQLTATQRSSAFRLTSEKVEQMQVDLTSDFSRYRFLVDFMEGDTEWEQTNTLMAVYQGYTPDDEEQVGLGVRRGWAQAFPGASPPDLSTAEGLVEALEADFPEDPDLLDGLEVIVETVYGGEAKRVSDISFCVVLYMIVRFRRGLTVISVNFVLYRVHVGPVVF